MHIGFLVNPIAGMGGAVGLKGTDGLIEEAKSRGAQPCSGERACQTLSLLKDSGIHLLTCSGAMGEESAINAGFIDYEVVYKYFGESTPQDTENAVKEFIQKNIDIIVFCGGDGTARDILKIVGRNVPLLGIPAGVKMYSAIFAIDPVEASNILLESSTILYHDAEVIDVDEEAYRRGELVTHLFGYARVPYVPEKIQAAKSVFESQDEDRAKEEIAAFIVELIRDDTLYILGAGTTIETIAKKIGVEKTLLGVDVLKGRTLVARDANEQILLELINKESRVKIIISPIGAQGFILGRGSQQISPNVIKKVGISNMIIVATPYKLSKTPVLYVDSGDPTVNTAFGDYTQVISGYRIAQRKRIYLPKH